MHLTPNLFPGRVVDRLVRQKLPARSVVDGVLVCQQECVPPICAAAEKLPHRPGRDPLDRSGPHVSAPLHQGQHRGLVGPLLALVLREPAAALA